MKKHYIYVLQLVLLIFFTGISYGQTTVIDPAGSGGFESVTAFPDDGWNATVSSSSSGNRTRWVSGTGATSGFTGNRAAYVSNNFSSPNFAHNYTTSSARITHLYRDVTIPAGATNILLDFRWISDGEYTDHWFYGRRVWDAMTVWLVPTSYTPTYGTVIDNGGGRLQLNGDYYNQDTWTNETNISIPNTYANSTFRLVFEWRNDGSSGSQPPAGIDNVYLRYTSPTPTITDIPSSSVCPGDSITITGTNLASATSASIGGTAATITGTTSTTVTLTVGNGTTGTVSITTPSGTATSSGSLTVNSNSVAPTGITGTTTVCAGDTTTLTLTGGSAGTGATAEWYSGSCGGVHVGTGNSVSVLPLAPSTTYFVRFEGTCNTTTCASVTVTVEIPVEGGLITGDNSVCQGDNNITYSVSGMLNATSYLWTVPTGATIESGQNTNSITVNYGASAINGNVSVTGSNTCGNHTVTLPITVNTAPTIELTSAVDTDSQTLCINSSLIPITYEIGGSATGASLSGALPAGVNYGFSAGVLTISGTPTASGSFNYTVTTTGGDCGTTSASGTIEVDALPTLTLTSAPTTTNQTLCILTPITNITYAVGGAATDASVTGLPAGVTGTYANGVLTISGTPTEAGLFNYTVTTSGSSCTAATISGSMTVNPLPDEAGTISGIDELCQGEEGVVYSVPAITNATGYNWTVPPGATIVAGANTNTITVDYGNSASSGDVTVEGTNACGVGVISILPITVNITPYIPTNYSVVACSESLITVTPENGGDNIIPVNTTYSWSLPVVTGGITGATALTGQANFNQTLVNPTNVPQTATYNVTATTAGCSSSTFAVIVTVNPKPVGQGLPATQVVCPNTPITTINFSQTTSISGAINYSWERDNIANVGGLSEIGSGSTINATFTNTTNTAQTTTFTVIASTQNGCDSDPFTVSVTVNPTPAVAASLPTQAICSDDTIAPILLTNPNGVSGTTFSWVRDNDSNITGIANGSGNSITGSLTNTTNVPQTTIFTITAWANGCPSSTTTASVTVNPKPTVAVNLPTQSLCAGTPISDIVISNPNNVAGVTYSWMRTNTANLTGIANSGSGSTISGTLINNTGTAQTTIFTVRATSGTCYSETTASVLVRPTPIVIVENPTTQTICNNESATITLGTSNVPIAGTTYSWTLNPNPNITASGPTSGTGNIITKTYQNSSTTPQVVSYTITATAGTCTTTTTVSPVTVNASVVAPVIGNPQTVCVLSTPAQLSMITPPNGGNGIYTYQWQRSLDDTNWTDITDATGTTYTPPFVDLSTDNTFYRLVVTDSCDQVFSDSIYVEVVSNVGFTFDVNDGISDPGNIVCAGRSFTPDISAIHFPTSRVRYEWSADPNFITPSTGGPVGSTSWYLLFSISDANIGPLTTINNTNATVTTQIAITPSVYNASNGAYICSVTPQYINVTIRPNPVAIPNFRTTTICSGASPGLEITGNIADAGMQFDWNRNSPTGISGTPSSGTGTITAGGTFVIPGTLTNSSTSTSRNVTYTITPRSNGCSGTPITVEVTVAPSLTAGVIASNQTVCFGEDPTTFTQTTAATGLNLSYQWQISTTSATTGFTDILGATNALYDAPGPLTQNTWYRRIATSTVNGVNCSSAPSNAVEVTVNIIDPGTISGEQTVCSGGDPGVLSSSAPATGVTGTLSYQWQMNTTGCGEPGASWSDISGANNDTYDPPNGLLVTTYYRRVARFSTGSCSEVSNCITVYVNNVTGGDVAGDQTICSDNPDAFTEAIASTGTGALTYQWQLSTTSSAGPWTNISGAYSATYDPPSGVTTTTYYKRVTTSTLNGQACTADSASVITVTASTLDPGRISANKTVCSGDIPTPFTNTTSATVGSGGVTYQWQSSTISGAGPWTDIAGATSDIYTFTSSVATTTYYQRVATSTLTGCSKVSNFLVVYVNDVTPSVITGDQTVCSTDDPAAFTVTTAASTSGPGTLSYQWQRSTTNAPYVWTNIPTATGATYNPPVLATTTYYRVMVTSRLNSVNCSDASNIVTVTVNPFDQATASSATPANCGDTTIQLTANGSGTWSAIPRTTGALYSFSDINNVNATFTGESGVIYDITWTIVNPAPCDESTATFALAFPACANNIDFNGTNNYTNFRDAFDFTGDFSIELWVKRNTVGNGKQTLFSKRDANDLSTGYDLSLQNGQLTFNWNAGGTLQTAETLDDSRWYHVAVTYDGNYRLYIDGIELASAAGSLPSSNAFNALLGATGVVAGIPQDYYNGSVDELRIWNTGLTEAQIREMMNQEIESNGTAVRGSVLALDIPGLLWADLEGYYQMNQGTSDIAAGQLADNSKTGTGNVGTLTNMVSNQLETAPLPYNTASNGNWNSLGTWLNGGVQQLPNSVGIDGNTTVDWNIVRTRHNVISDTKDLTILGLIVEANELTITGPGAQDETNPGTGLWVTHYLKIDGKIDLVGESQLVQKRYEDLQANESFFDPGSIGVLERDQQGTGNPFNYNYWSSPVSSDIVTFTLLDVLRAGTISVDDPFANAPITWITGHTPNPVFSGGNTIQLTTRWLYTYNGTINYYTEWNRINNTTPIGIGLGFSMKGNGADPGPTVFNGSTQNYVFVGKPNNGTILNNVAAGNSILLGNPYPSAIDADKFINDNIGILDDGSLSFWEHYPANNTHVVRNYVGGYATYNLVGGQAAVTPPPTLDGYGIVDGYTGTREPTQYIPVAQGFFVSASTSGGDIVFNNSQRVFSREAGGESIFFRASEGGSKATQKRTTSNSNDIQRVRLTFKTPEGAIRPLLLGFTPNNAASDGIDYGYDAYNNDGFPSDLSFAIEGKKFVIQGVGAFDINKKYPLDMLLKIAGNIEIALSELENFDTDPDIFIYDALLDTYTKINDVSFQTTMKPGQYKDRFYIAFQPDTTLSIIDEDFKDISVKYLQKTDEIYVKTPASIEVRQVYLINIAGQAVRSWNMTNMN
ncbi:hypothetical protein M8845_15680, partial [Gelidibacter japonicus]|uniref:PKD-like domain-containing protein n=1 Tax=Gelidibacter japonicus TaxID=1962232 RepID=UPI00325FAE2E|nr:hypothetical protein [Gelidibacter japonicus]